MLLRCPRLQEEALLAELLYGFGGNIIISSIRSMNAAMLDVYKTI